MVISFVIVLEKFFNYSSFGRSVLFFGSLIIIALAFSNQFLVPFLKSQRLINRMSYKQAADLINDYIPKVADRLTNVIELEEISSHRNNSLINASISQKSLNILAFDLLGPLTIKKYQKYIISFLTLLLFSFICSISFPKVVFGPLKRVIRFNDYISTDPSYSFLINGGENLCVLEGENLDLSIKTYGKSDPEQIIIYAENRRFFPVKKSKFNFEYRFENNLKPFSFYLKDGAGDTVNFLVNVLPKAKLLKETKIADYPKYTGLKNDTFDDFSKVIIPRGTDIYWNIKAKNTSSVSVSFMDTSYNFLNDNNLYSFVYRPKISQKYFVKIKNDDSNYSDSLMYEIELTNDKYPTISYNEFFDSVYKDHKFFVGEIEDDFGFSKLSFVYSSSIDSIKKTLPINFENSRRCSFNFDFDFAELQLKSGEEIFYYFSVWDNDGLGPKETQSKKIIFKLPSEEEKKKQIEKNIKEQEEAFKNIKSQVSTFHDDLKKIKSSIMNKKALDWNDKNNIQNFLQKQKLIEFNLENLKEKMKEETAFQNNSINQEIEDKKELLNKLVDEIMSDEMKKLYDELNEILNDLNKEKILDKIEDINFSQENLIKELDRAIEHFKRIEIEKKADEIASALNKLSKQQEKLSKKTKDKEISAFEKINQQEKIKSDFYSIKEELLELKDKNKELSNPKNINTEEEENKLKQDLKSAEDGLSKNNNNKAEKAQKKASENMKKMADKMSSLSMSNANQVEEDMASLRLLLEQLVTFSINQENLLSSLKKTNSQDPKYVLIGKEQRKLKDEIRIIDDSLAELAKRQLMISNKINNEVQSIKRSLSSSIRNLTERKTRTAKSNQQKVMMHTNELALLLSEVMEQMQNSMPGTGQCNKPGGKGSRPGSSNPKTSEQLKKQIEAMKKFLEDQKSGNNPNGKEQSFEKLGRMAAEQAAIKKKLMEMAQKMNNDGSKKGNGLKKIIEQLEEVEKQLINNEIDLSSVIRQEEIKVKLLELEKASRQQEEEQKRESNEGKDNYKLKNIELYKEYLKTKNKEIELLKSIPPNLKPYYKNKVNEYFKKLEN
tara:strand:+ start:7248 stop:10430 length:3183 start_codon:yes stop_codon:yes gene_type:complete